MGKPPTWDECKKHVVQSDSMTVDNDLTGSGPNRKFVFLKVNCFYCGCPGEAVVEVLEDEIEWGPNL